MTPFTQFIFVVVSFTLLSSAWAQRTLAPSDLCQDNSAADIVTFADAVLESEVREALSIGPQEALTCELASSLSNLDASGPGARRSVSGSPEWQDVDHSFHDLSGIQNLTGLTDLALRNRGLSDISPLAELTGMIDMEHLFLSHNQIETIDALRRLHKLKVLRLENNDISDLSALASLDQLDELSLAQNWSLYDVQPLLMNAGLGEGDELDLRFTYVRCSDMDTFADKGINLLRVTAINGSACPGRRLVDP